MKTLLIDAGNSRLKWAEASASGFDTFQFISYANQSPVEACRQLLEQFNSQLSIVLVHVLGVAFENQVQQLCCEAECQLLSVHSENAYGVSLAYSSPKAYGADRFVGIVAAHSLYPEQTCIVVDCGTAITVDTITSDGEHLGGLIFPGLNLSYQSLLTDTKAIQASLESRDLSTGYFAKDTRSAVYSGCFYAAVGAIEGICRGIQQELTINPHIILTGGDADRLSARLSGQFSVNKSLIFEGLYQIARDKALV
jgi:type III pantothenate kinase